MLILCGRCAFKCVLSYVLLFDYSKFDFCVILLACFITMCHALFSDSFHASFNCYYFSEVHCVP